MNNKVEIILDAVDKTGGAFGSVGSALKTLGTVALAAFGTAAVATGKFLVDSIQEAATAELAIADLNAVITSTKGVAGITLDAAQDIASGLQSVTRFSDETIMKAEGMLLTFTNIGKNVFPQATETVLDMAEKFGGAENASIQLGKALNNPVEGLSALRRVGVAFTDEQENLIKSLMAAGKIEEAQKIILGELQTEFGGLARAAGDTTIGLKDRFFNQLSDIKELIGTAVLPAVSELGETLLTKLSDPKVQEFISVFAQKLGDISVLTLDWIIDLPNKIQALGDAVAASPFGTFLEFLGLWWEANGESIRNTAVTLFDGIRDAIGRAADTLGPFVEEILAKLMLWMAENGPLISETVAVIGAAFGYLVEALVIFWESIQPVLSGFFDLVLSIGTFAMQVLTGNWSAAWESIKAIVSNVSVLIGTILSSFLSLVLQLFGSTTEEFIGVWSSNWNMLVTIVGQVKDIIMGKLGEWYQVGAGIIQYMIDGVKSAVGSLVSAAVEAVSSALNAASSFLGGSSGGSSSSRYGTSRGYAAGTGGLMQVPSGFPNDTYPIRLTSGETFGVWPAGSKTPSMAGGGIVVNFTYAPALSLGNEAEMREKISPIFLDLVREAQNNGVLPV